MSLSDINESVQSCGNRTEEVWRNAVAINANFLMVLVLQAKLKMETDGNISHLPELLEAIENLYYVVDDIIRNSKTLQASVTNLHKEAHNQLMSQKIEE